jgi:predicted nucleic acid-binding Zn ribbon protein
MMNPMKRTMGRLSATIAKVLKASGLESHLSEYHVFGQWEKAVGEVIARHARPVSMRGKKLTLVVDSPAWMQQLSLLKPEIAEKLNRNLGKELVKDIKLTLGEVAAAAKPADTRPSSVSLDQRERVTIEQYAGEVHDPDIRDAIRRVMEKDFLSRKKGQKK